MVVSFRNKIHPSYIFKKILCKIGDGTIFTQMMNFPPQFIILICHQTTENINMLVSIYSPMLFAVYVSIFFGFIIIQQNIIAKIYKLNNLLYMCQR